MRQIEIGVLRFVGEKADRIPRHGADPKIVIRLITVDHLPAYRQFVRTTTDRCLGTSR